MAGPEGLRKELDQKQIALVAGLFVVLIALLYFFVLSGGGGDDELGAPPPIATPGTVTETEGPAEEPEVAEEPEDGPVETFETFTRRDPFEPSVDLTGFGSDTDSDTTGDGSDTGSDDTGNGSDAGNGGGNGNGGPSGQAVGGHRVKLVDVFTQNGRQRAQIQVDGTVYTVDPGETFAESFQLVSISGDCASILFGDDQFTICEGEEILK